MQNLPSILVLHVSRALELCIGLRAELQGGAPLCTACSIHSVASTLGGQRCCKAFGRAQCFEVRHVDSATTYRAQHFLNQSKAGLAKFENLNTQPPESIDHSCLGSMNDTKLRALERQYKLRVKTGCGTCRRSEEHTSELQSQ